MRPGTVPATVPAWDWPTRVFKWGLVLLVLNAWLTHRGGDDWLGAHIANGYAILVLLVFRLLWGVVGSSTARFEAWVASPLRAMGYGLALLTGRGRRYLSHNPLGGWMILALMAAVFAQAFAGLFTVDSNGIAGGPFANTDPMSDPTPLQKQISWWHFRGFTLILALAAIHVAANLFHQFVKREPVIQAMVTGVKPQADYVDQPAMRRAPGLALRALACLAAALALVLGGIRLAAGHLL